MNWSKYEPYFKPREFFCRHCGEEDMVEGFMDVLLEVRKRYGRPMVITSGYRCPNHPIEAHKLTKSGAHPQGMGADVGVYGEYAVDLVEVALSCGVIGIGVQQKGEIKSRFIHLDTMPRPPAKRMIWTYE